MIVPRNSLLVWTGLVVLPLGLLGAAGPDWTKLTGLLAAGFIWVALVDALRGRIRLDGVRVEVPPLARMSKDRPAKLDLRLRNERAHLRQLRLAIGWPSEIESPVETMDLVLPKPRESAYYGWPCLPRRRGRYTVSHLYLEAASPFGWWSWRQAVPVALEIRVYPNLLRERKSLAAHFLHRGALGVHTQRQIGQGHEFEKLREYVPGDSFTDVHWKATARRGRPITKTFQVERTQEVYLILDTSRLSARPAPPAPDQDPATSVLERCITAGLMLGLAAEQQGDLFGLLTFSDKVRTFVRAKNGHAHFSVCRDALYTVQPQLVSPDFDEVCTFIRLRLRRRTLLIFLTALDDPELAASFVKNADLIRRQHLVLVNMLQPPGVGPVFSGAEVAEPGDLYRRLAGHLQWSKLHELEKILHRRGVRFQMLKNERLSPELVSQYLQIKQRQLL
jgi:uncharacterized protein (DUF58 family)